MKEVFRPIKDFPGYLVSNRGRVLSTKQGTGKIVKPCLFKGQKQMRLRRDGEYHKVTLARLVAAEFLEIPAAGYWKVTHIDGDLSNDEADNLKVIPSKSRTGRAGGKKKGETDYETE